MRDVPLGPPYRNCRRAQPRSRGHASGSRTVGCAQVSAVTNDGFRPNENKVVRSPSLYTPLSASAKVIS